MAWERDDGECSGAPGRADCSSRQRAGVSGKKEKERLRFFAADPPCDPHIAGPVAFEAIYRESPRWRILRNGAISASYSQNFLRTQMGLATQCGGKCIL